MEAGSIKDGVSTPFQRVMLQLENNAEALCAPIPKLSDAPLKGGGRGRTALCVKGEGRCEFACLHMHEGVLGVGIHGN